MTHQDLDAAESTRPGLVRLELALACVWACLTAWCINCVSYLPTNDGPQHAFAGYVEAHFRDPSSGWPQMYALNNPPTSNGYVDIFVPLLSVFSVETSHQIVITAIALLWALAWFFWLRGEVGRGLFLPLVAFPCALQWCFWIGLYPFLLSSAAIPIALIIRRRFGLTVIPGIGLAVLLVASARIHVFGAALCGVLLVGLCANGEDRLRAFLATALIGIPSFLYALFIAAESSVLSPGNGGTVWETPYNTVDMFLEYFLPGPRLMQVMFLAIVGLAIATGFRTTRRRHLVLAVGVGVLSIGLLLPLDFSGWELVRPRLLPTAFMLILGGAALQRRSSAVIVPLVIIFSCWRFWWVADLNERAAAEVAPMVEIATDVDLRGRTWVYIVTEGPTSHSYDEVRLASSILHLGQMVAPRLGGAPLFSHDGDATMHHILRLAPRQQRWLGPVHKPDYARDGWNPTRNRRMRDLVISTYLASLSFVDDVLVYGLPGDGEVFKEAGYAVTAIREDSTGHTLFRGRFVGCSWNITVAGLKEPTVVGIGFGLEPAVQDAYIVGESGALTIDGVPCGPAWLTVEAGCTEDRGAAEQLPIHTTDEVQDIVCHVPVRLDG